LRQNCAIFRAKLRQNGIFAQNCAENVDFLREIAPKMWTFCAILRQNVDFLRDFAPKCGLFARNCAENVDFLRDFAPFFWL
jgi:hypothetical protein